MLARRKTLPWGTDEWSWISGEAKHRLRVCAGEPDGLTERSSRAHSAQHEGMAGVRDGRCEASGEGLSPFAGLRHDGRHEGRSEGRSEDG